LRSPIGSVLRWLLPRMVVALSYGLFRSCRIQFVGKEHEDRFVAHGRQIIFAGWHEGKMMLPYHFRDRAGGLVMVSASRDGDLIADTVERFGLRAVRGSSGHGGTDALAEIIAGVRAGGVSAGMIVDGPRGPALVAKAGAIALARATGLPIVPGTWWARPAITFGSWDRTIMPWPLARLVFAFEEPMVVPANATAADIELLRTELTRRLGVARQRARTACGVTECAPEGPELHAEFTS
jgi:lysophospholipid acyltransferase (LPLAT)-like uncharacterized protein